MKVFVAKTIISCMMAVAALLAMTNAMHSKRDLPLFIFALAGTVLVVGIVLLWALK